MKHMRLASRQSCRGVDLETNAEPGHVRGLWRGLVSSEPCRRERPARWQSTGSPCRASRAFRLRYDRRSVDSRRLAGRDPGVRYPPVGGQYHLQQPNTKGKRTRPRGGGVGAQNGGVEKRDGGLFEGAIRAGESRWNLASREPGATLERRPRPGHRCEARAGQPRA